MTWFVNYIVDDAISPADRGLAYGDGVFETIHATPVSLLQLDNHLARLYKGLNKLGMSLSPQRKQELEDFLLSDILPLVSVDSVVKIIVTRGEGGRGYLPPEEPSHTVCIGILPCPDYSLQQQQGVSLSISPVTVSSNRFLAGIKHLNRLENVLAKQHLSDSDFEAIMLDDKGDVIECIQSNIFWFKGGKIYTPSLEFSGVEGTYRKQIIEHFDGDVQLGSFKLNDVLSADEVFITNSLMKIVPVINIADTAFVYGSLTKALQHEIQKKEENAIR
ncbi:aminodeoxychorismate lyase [Marinomonas sp. C2222]|uniref:Aminodeoxychorismate lyase n=1 Tax=Marinomonas sargassi TaxID=2984494 RepID=A0ABT2YSJ8_9GAMM|nr:aminodeoxychorismate lyase [Marinomonas sargassi]MCV2402861.1 aminodeoxychorismate lyase [Marinomonas sargassi]